MRRIAVLGALMGLLAQIGYAACDATLTPTYTTNVGFAKPQINSCSWGAQTNANWGIVDSSVAIRTDTKATGIKNTGIGSQSFSLTASGQDNTGYGYQALHVITSGNDNSCFGQLACGAVQTGSRNNAVGSGAIGTNANGNDNNAFGQTSLFNLSGGSDNSAFGSNSCTTVGLASQNTCIGSGADVTTSGISSSTVIGYKATSKDSGAIVIGPNTTSNGDHTAVIGSSNGVTNEYRLYVSSITTKQIILNTIQPYLILATSQTVVTTSSATVVTSFVRSGTAVTITPHSTLSRFKITYSGNCANNLSLTGEGRVTIERNGTNIGDSTNGFCEASNSATGQTNLSWMCAFTYFDSPATISSITYEIYFRTDNAGSSFTLNSLAPAILNIEEYDH